MQTRDNIQALVVITNDLVALGNIWDKLEDFFIIFIDNIFKPLDYKFIYTGDEHFSKINSFTLVWKFISQELKKNKIKFYDAIQSDILTNTYYTLFPIDYVFLRRNLVLEWAGEGYPNDKLIVENFLKFYKKDIITDGDYYIRQIIKNFIPRTSTIDNLPFTKANNAIYFKTDIRFLVWKEKIDLDLQKLAEIVIDFWNCYKLETYYENYRLVFNMRQNEFDALVKSSSVLE